MKQFTDFIHYNPIKYGVLKKIDEKEIFDHIVFDVLAMANGDCIVMTDGTEILVGVEDA